MCGLMTDLPSNGGGGGGGSGRVTLASAGRPGLETTTITREALEGLAQQAGLTVDWNNGDPVINAGPGIASRVSPTRLVDLAADGIAKGASSVMDDMVRRVMQDVAAGKKAKAALKAKGATDEDIAAAEKLLRSEVADDRYITKGMSYQGIVLDEVGWKSSVDWTVLRAQMGTAGGRPPMFKLPLPGGDV